MTNPKGWGGESFKDGRFAETDPVETGKRSADSS